MEVELATLGWVHWHNTERLHGYLGDLPPVEFEALHTTAGELESSYSSDQSAAKVAARAADRLSEPQPEHQDSQNTPNIATDALSEPHARPPWPPLPPGAVAIMCGNPGSAVQRTPGRSKRT